MYLLRQVVLSGLNANTCKVPKTLYDTYEQSVNAVTAVPEHLYE